MNEYLVDMNAAAAYRRAGYRAKDDHNASVNASALMARHGISLAIKEALDARSGRVQVTADRVLQELARVAFSDPRKLYHPDGTLKPPSEWDDETAASIAGVETDENTLRIDEKTTLTTRTHKVKRWNKIAALENLGKHLGMFESKAPPASPSLTVTVVAGVHLDAIAGAHPGLHLPNRSAGRADDEEGVSQN